MYSIKEEELVSLHKKIDEIEKKRKDLDELNNIYIEKNEKKSKQIKVLGTVCILLFLFLCVCVVKIYNDTTMLPQKKAINQKLASSKADIKKAPVVATSKIIYAVQLGVYKKLNVEFESIVYKIKIDDTYHYVVGSFKTEKEAKQLKTLLSGLKVKGAFVVKLKSTNGVLVRI